MMPTKSYNKLRLAYIFLISIFLFAQASFSEEAKGEWILAACPFVFTQNNASGPGAKAASEMIPSLIMEQIYSGSERAITAGEKKDRETDTLLTERIALFLELSKEFKTRDNLVLKNFSALEFHSEVKKQEKKIRDIETKIEKNLLKDKEINRRPEDMTDKERAKRMRRPEKIESEKITIYKNDTEQLFKPGEEIWSERYSSRSFSKAVASEKINGLITGTIVVYGQYCAVTAELFVYPGAVSQGIVTEVGAISEPGRIAENIAFHLIPKIANRLPVELEVHLKPKGLENDADLTIDNVVYDSIPPKIILDSGVHVVSVEVPGYSRETFVYNFSGRKSFEVDISLKELSDGKYFLTQKNFYPGLLFIDGNVIGNTSEAEYNSIPVKVNGNAVIGHFEGKCPAVRKRKSPLPPVKQKKAEQKNDEMTAESISEPENTDTEKSEEKSEEKLEENSQDKPDAEKKTNESQGFDVSAEDEVKNEIMFFFIPPELITDGEQLEVNMKIFDVGGNIEKRRRMMYASYSALIMSLPFLFYSYGTYSTLYKGYTSNYGNVSWNELNKYQTMSFAAIGISVACGVWLGVELVRYFVAVDSALPVQARKVSKKTRARKAAAKAALEVNQEHNQEEVPKDENISESENNNVKVE